MIDEKNGLPRQDNIKGLVQDLSEVLDARMGELRKGTPLEGVRPSDAKTFMMAARHPRSIAALAKSQGISRQAAHKSVQRLVDRGVVELKPSPTDNRDKLVHVTANGQTVRRLAARSLEQIEREIEDKIGKSRLEEFRRILRELGARET